MTLRNLATRALFLLALTPAAAAPLGAFDPSQIEGSTVKNPGIGFHGLTITFPSTDYGGTMPGVHTDEIIVFGRGNMGVALCQRP